MAADFFGKIKSGIDKGVAMASTGSKTMLEKSKINTRIKNLESEIKDLAEIMGNKVYNFCVNNPEGDIPRAEFLTFCGEISTRNEQMRECTAQIAALEEEMNQVKGVSSTAPVTCACGQVNSPGAKFCAKCGNQLF